MNCIGVLLMLCVCMCCDAATRAPPVIIVPGLGGSRLEAKLNRTSSEHFLCEKTSKDYFPIWFSYEFLVPVVKQCWMDNIKLTYDNVTRTTSSHPGVDIRVPGFGNPRYVEWLDAEERLVGVFNTLAASLVDLGYERNASLRAAPYDFRKGPSESGQFFDSLKSLVESTYKINGNRKVMLLAHSMGAPMTAIFLRKQQQSWKDKFIRGFISLNGVFAGSVKALKTYVVGDDLNEFFIPESFVKTLQISSSSLPLLMPYSGVWKDGVLVETPSKNYSMGNIEEFFVDIGYETGWEMWKDQLPDLNLDPPGVEVHCLYGTGIPTITRLRYDQSSHFPNKPSFEYGSGDGTVNLQSLDSCSRWTKQQKQKVYVQSFSGMDHNQILSDSRVLKYISKLLLNILH
uniref:Group XV phospholipase A2 n=1 Tax=Lygus hesperus TaxID=30085 RepID=A0A146LY53_LYGHE